VYGHELPDDWVHIACHQLGWIVDNRRVVIVSLEFKWHFPFPFLGLQGISVLRIRA
jgi:hypothetical protein